MDQENRLQQPHTHPWQIDQLLVVYVSPSKARANNAARLASILVQPGAKEKPNPAIWPALLQPKSCEIIA
jgi:hypothetical protein